MKILLVLLLFSTIGFSQSDFYGRLADSTLTLTA